MAFGDGEICDILELAVEGKFLEVMQFGKRLFFICQAFGFGVVPHLFVYQCMGHQ